MPGRLPSPRPVNPHKGVGRHGQFGDRLLRRLREIDALHGVTASAGLQGTGGATGVGDATDSELVTIGRAHEFGIGVPERPWLRTAAATYGRDWVGGFRHAAKQRIKGDQLGSVGTIRQVGVAMVADVQKTIREGPWEDLADSTKARRIAKHGSKGRKVTPLIDTGQMIQSVRAALEEPGRTPELIG